METERTIQIRVGIFVTAGLVLAMFAIFMIGSERSWFEKRYQLHCTFDDISGLGKGASVTLAGMGVGSVAEVRFPDDLSRREVVAILDINVEFRDRIRTDSVASIVTQGLLGDKMVSLTVGSPEADALSDGDSLSTAPAGDLYSIGKSASDLIAEARKAMQSVNELVATAKDGRGVLHALLYDPAGESMVRDFGSGARSFRLLADRANGQGWGDVVANLDRATADLQTITGQIRRGEGTLGAILTDDAIYNDLRAIFGRAQRNVLLKSMVRSMIRANEMDLGTPSK